MFTLNYVGLNSFVSYAYISLSLKLKIISYIRNVNSIYDKCKLYFFQYASISRHE